MKLLKDKDIESANGAGETFLLGEIIGKTAPIHKEDYSIAVTVLEKGGKVIPHYHKISDETYIFIEGSCVMKINGELIDISKGTTIVIEPGDVHEILPAEEKCVFYAITIPAFIPEDFIAD
ncbi:MAG: cupin domain-containing protein [Erysipelotrichaceae bacterium]|nr:cupin domain-containing protein [Erysipelotrichaceae bacterium]